MKSTSCFGALAALTMAASLACFSEARAQTPYDYVYWPFFDGWTYHAKPAPRMATRPSSAPPRRAVAYNNVHPPVIFSPALIFGVGY